MLMLAASSFVELLVTSSSSALHGGNLDLQYNKSLNAKANTVGRTVGDRGGFLFFVDKHLKDTIDHKLNMMVSCTHQ